MARDNTYNNKVAVEISAINTNVGVHSSLVKSFEDHDFVVGLDFSNETALIGANICTKSTNNCHTEGLYRFFLCKKVTNVKSPEELVTGFLHDKSRHLYMTGRIRKKL